MSPANQKQYFAILYTTLGLIVAANLIFGIRAGEIPYLSITIQALVVLAALARQSWSHYVVMIWSGICMVGVAAMWLAMAAHGAFTYPIGVILYKTLLFFDCGYLVYLAKEAFSAPIRDTEQADGA
jgi:hypothetical protein